LAAVGRRSGSRPCHSHWQAAGDGEGIGAVVVGEVGGSLEIGGVGAGRIPLIAVDGEAGAGIGHLQRSSAGTTAGELAAGELVVADVEPNNAAAVEQNVGIADDAKVLAEMLERTSGVET